MWTLLTAASNLDDQVAVENSAASQILGRSYRVDGLVSHAQFRAKAGASNTGQSASIDKKGGRGDKKKRIKLSVYDITD